MLWEKKYKIIRPIHWSIHCVQVIPPRIPEPQISQLRRFQGVLLNVSRVIIIHHLFSIPHKRSLAINNKPSAIK